MIKFENLVQNNLDFVIRSMRNPMNSWDKSDSNFYRVDTVTNSFTSLEDPTGKGDVKYLLGENDVKLMLRLRDSGSDHRKFMRMINIVVDITAPLYWWKEFDTYKIGTVTNSCSTMHTLHKRPLTISDFSHEHLISRSTVLQKYETPLIKEDGKNLPSFETTPYDVLLLTIECINEYRKLYVKTKDKNFWWQMIQLLPSNYNQKRTVMLNYETLLNIYKSRKHHKLDEWKDFCLFIETDLIFPELITRDEIKND